MSTLHVFEIDDGEQSWYAAHTSDEALKMHLEPLVGFFPEDVSTIPEKDLPCSLDKIEVRQLPDDEVLKVVDEDNDMKPIERTAAEWAADGKGFVACTCW